MALLTSAARWIGSGTVILITALTGCGTPQGGPIRSPASGPQAVVTLSIRSPLSALPVPPTAVREQVGLPLYPGSEATSRRLPYPVDPTVGNPYVLTGLSRFVVPASASKLTAWAQREFPRHGMPLMSTGTAGNIYQSTTETDLSFGVAPGADGLTVTVDLSSLNPTHTLLEYYVTDLVVPPRPTSSMVPADLLRAVVTVSGEHRSVTITSRKALTALRDAVNGRRHLAAGTLVCPNLSGPSVKVTFYPRNGAPTVVTAPPLCTDQVGSLGLLDAQGVVWHTVSAVLKQVTGQGLP